MPFKRPPPKKRAAAAVLDSADAFLAQGVAFEESAEKWRAGDAVKAARFYSKALDTYAAGLARFPGTFDLQYNAARAQFAVTQHPAVAAQFPESVANQLGEALTGHEVALRMDAGRDNADVLFNTAQVLRSFAEALDESDERGLSMLETSVAHLGRCLDIQDDKLKARVEVEQEAARQLAEAQREGFTTDGQGTANGDTQTEMQSDRDDLQEWAFIEEPVTLGTVLDTCVAIAEALTDACEAAAARGMRAKLQEIEKSADLFLQHRAQSYIDDADTSDRVGMCAARAKMKSALLDAAYKMGSIDVNAYDSGIAVAFEVETRYLDATNPSFLCAQAETLLDFVDTVRDKEGAPAKRWTRLDKALNLFSTAVKATNEPADQSQIHISRGDVELLRLGISLDPEAPRNLQEETVRRTLLQNAQKFYRAARVSVQGDLGGAAQRNSQAAQIREAIAAAIEQESFNLSAALRHSDIDDVAIRGTLEEMSEASIVPSEIVTKMISSIK